MSEVQQTVVWYRQFWPWFLISLPASAVVAGIATIIIAVVTDDGLVVDDYYKQGLAINQEQAKDRMASHLGLNAEVNIDLHTGEAAVVLHSAVAIPAPELVLTLVHPTRAVADVSIPLTATAVAGHYSGRFDPAPGIHWRLLLTPKGSDWRLVGRYSGVATTQLQSDG